MSPQRRRARSPWRAIAAAVAAAPYVVADLFPRRRRGDLGRRHRWTRPRRIAVALGALVVLAGAATTVMFLSRGRDPMRRMWRLHDEAVASFRAGRYEEVLVYCDEILAITPDNAVARFNKGAALLKLGRKDEGLRAIREAAVVRPDFDDAHMALAQDALSRGDDDEALAELRKVVQERPSPGAAESMLAAILRRRGRDAEAMPHLEAAAADPSADPIERVRDGLALARMHALRATVGRVAAKEKRLELDCYAEARRVADEALERAAADPKAPTAELHAARAQLLLASGKVDEALVDVDLALSLTQDGAAHAGLRMLRAQVYAVSGDAAAADKELAAALASPEKPAASAFRQAAGVYAAAGRLDAALDILSQGATVHASDIEIGLSRARLLFMTGKVAEAEAECVRVAALDSRADGATLLLGDLRRAQGDLDGARKSYEEAQARCPDDVQARLRVAGVVLAETGEASKDSGERLAEAERIAAEVLLTSPDEPGALLARAKVRLARSPGRDPPKKAADPNDPNALAWADLVKSVDGDPLSIEARTFLAYADYLTRRDQEGAVELRHILDSLRADRPRLRVLLARCLFGAGAFADAAAEAKRAVTSLPDDVDAWKVRADATRAAGDRDGALEALRRLETLEPKSLVHVFAQAAIFAEQGRFAAAEERFAAAEERAKAIVDEGGRDDAHARVAKARAEFYCFRGDFKRAKDVFGEAAAGSRTTASAHVLYAKFLMTLGQTEDAEREIERGLAVEPGSLDARRLLCEILFARAVASPVLAAQVQEVERIAPKDPVVNYLRGKQAALQGDFRVAKELLGRYVASRPDDADGRYALGAVHAKAGEYAEAVKRFEEAGEMLPGSPDVRVALAKTRQAWALEMMRRGRFVEAQATLRQAVTDDPASKDARALLADTLRFTGDVELSEKEIRALLHADATDRAAMRMLAAVQVQQGKLDDAAVTLKSLTEVAKDDWSAWQFLSGVLADKGDLDGAEVAAKAARNAAPDEPAAMSAMLHVLTIRRPPDFAAAEREIVAAAQMHPEEPQYPFFLAMLREQQGRYEDVVAAAGKALDLRPSMPGALQLAISALSSGLLDPKRAVAFARERAAKAPDDWTMAFQLASLEAETGGRDRALALLEPICKQGAPLPAAFSLRAMLLLEAGEFAATREGLRKGIEAYADAVDLHYLLAQSWLADPANVKDGEPQEPARGFAVAELRLAVKILRTHAPALNNLAWLLSRDEATRAEALQCAETIVQLRPDHAAYVDTLGSVLQALGRTDLAVAAFRKALGACETERAALDRRAAGRVSSIEAAKIDVLRKRLERTTADIKAHYDAAMKAASGK